MPTMLTTKTNRRFLRRYIQIAVTILVFYFEMGQAFSQTLLLQESFETDGEGSRYTSNTFYTAANDFFERTRDSNIKGRNDITNVPGSEDGNYYWACEDCDVASGGEGLITFNAVNVTGYDLNVDVALAIGRPDDFRFENEDYFIIEYNMDGAGWNIFGAFYGDNGTDKGNLVQDTDLDGTIDVGAAQLNSFNFTDFNFTIPVTGSSVQLRARVLGSTGTEEILFDNIRLKGTASSSAPTSATVAAKAFLEGAFNGTGLNTTLNGSIPTAQPYGSAAFNNHPGTESASAPAGAVDWILVELREAASAASALNSTKVGSAAGFLMSDGSIKATDGSSNLTVSLSGNIGASFYVVIYHRNHLPIMSASAISESGSLYTIDFTSASANTYQTTTALASLSGGRFGLPAGDTDGDGDVDATDLTTWRSNNGGTFSYSGSGIADFNLDGVINAIDRNGFHQKNTSKTRQVPTT